MNYYNEIDAGAAQWLRNLIERGLIPSGHVDQRSIKEVQADDLKGFTQCHFFAGIAGWSLALEIAGWSEDVAVWTGSCPCQPFSLAGSQKGFADDRHLWPEWFRLIRQCRPAIVFGEQVASAAEWLRLVRSDLEAVGYSVGAMPIEAASGNADQLRDRFWFVAHDDEQQPGTRLQRGRQLGGTGRGTKNTSRLMAGGGGARLERMQGESSHDSPQLATAERSGVRSMECAPSFGWGEGWTEHELRSGGIAAAVASIGSRQVIECPDGKWRTLPPSRVRWLGNGIPARVAKLRAFGNAIVPHVAAEFIAAYMDLATPPRHRPRSIERC